MNDEEFAQRFQALIREIKANPPRPRNHSREIGKFTANASRLRNGEITLADFKAILADESR